MSASCAPSSAPPRPEETAHEHRTQSPPSARGRRRPHGLPGIARRQSAGRDRHQGLAPRARARPAFHLYQHQSGRQRGRLGRQDRHGPGHRHRLDQDDRRGARPADGARQHGAGPHRPDHRSGRRLRLDRNLEGGRGHAQRRRRSPPRAGGDGGREARRAGRALDGRGRRRQRQERRRPEGELRRADRRPPLRHTARMEPRDRQRASGQRQGQAEVAERIQNGRQVRHQAARYSAQGDGPARIHGT